MGLELGINTKITIAGGVLITLFGSALVFSWQAATRINTIETSSSSALSAVSRVEEKLDKWLREVPTRQDIHSQIRLQISDDTKELYQKLGKTEARLDSLESRLEKLTKP